MLQESIICMVYTQQIICCYVCSGVNKTMQYMKRLFSLNQMRVEEVSVYSHTLVTWYEIVEMIIISVQIELLWYSIGINEFIDNYCIEQILMTVIQCIHIFLLFIIIREIIFLQQLYYRIKCNNEFDVPVYSFCLSRWIHE